MSKKIFALSLVLLSSAFAATSYARGGSSGALVTLNAYMYNSTTEVNGNSSDANTSIYDIKAGYLGGNGLYLGGLYTMRSSKSGSDSVSGNAYGPSLGYVGASGFFIQGHYLLGAEDRNLKEGSGLQADLGYLNNVTGSVMVGLELSYRSLEYKKDKDGNDVAKTKVTELFPMLTVGFVF